MHNADNRHGVCRRSSQSPPSFVGGGLPKCLLAKRRTRGKVSAAGERADKENNRKAPPSAVQIQIVRAIKSANIYQRADMSDTTFSPALSIITRAPIAIPFPSGQVPDKKKFITFLACKKRAKAKARQQAKKLKNLFFSFPSEYLTIPPVLLSRRADREHRKEVGKMKLTINDKNRIQRGLNRDIQDYFDYLRETPNCSNDIEEKCYNEISADRALINKINSAEIIQSFSLNELETIGFAISEAGRIILNERDKTKDKTRFDELTGIIKELIQINKKITKYLGE